MELQPRKIAGLGTYWAASLHGKTAKDLVSRSLSSGYLYKQSGAFSKGWERRFFLLLPTQLLLYFETPDDADPRGMMLLSPDSTIDQHQEDMAGRSGCFSLRPLPTEDAARVLHLSADSPDEVTAWCEALFTNRSDVLRAEAKSLKGKRDELFDSIRKLEAELAAAKAEAAAAEKARSTEVAAASQLASTSLPLLQEAVAVLAGKSGKSSDKSEKDKKSQLSALEQLVTECCESFPASSSSNALEALRKSLTDASAEAELKSNEAAALSVLPSSVATASATTKAAAANIASLLPQFGEALHAFATALAQQKERAELAESTLERVQEEAARAADEAAKQAEDSRNRETAMQAGWKEKEAKIANIFNQLNDKLKAERESSKTLQGEMDTLKESLKKAVEAAAEAKKLAAKALKEKNDAILVATAAAKDAEAVKQAIAEATAKQQEAEALAAEKEREAAAAAALAAAAQKAAAAAATAVTAANDDPSPPRPAVRSRAGSLSDTLSALLGDNSNSTKAPMSALDEAMGLAAANLPASSSSSSSLSSSSSTALVPAGPAAPVDALSFGAADGSGSGGGGIFPQPATFSPFNILAEPHPGRLYIIVMGVRHLPSYGFGTFGNKSAYAKLSLPDQSERQTRPSDVIDKGPTRGLCAAFNQVHVFKATRALDALPLRVDLYSSRTMTKDQRLGSAVLDLSPSGEWARQPHAVWLLLHPPSSDGSDASFIKPDAAEILVPVQPNCKLPLGPGAAGGTSLPGSGGGGGGGGGAGAGSATGSGAGGLTTRSMTSSLQHTFSAPAMSAAFGRGGGHAADNSSAGGAGPDFSSASSSNPGGPLSNTTTSSQAAAAVDFDINAMIAANQKSGQFVASTSVAIATSASQRHHIIRPSVTSGGTGFGFIAGATPGGVFANSGIPPARAGATSGGDGFSASPYGAARSLTVSGRWAMPELPIPPVDGNKPAVLVQVIYSPNGDELRPNGPAVSFHLPQMLGGGGASTTSALSNSTAMLTPLPSISEKGSGPGPAALASASSSSSSSSSAAVSSSLMATPPHPPPPVVAVPASTSTSTSSNANTAAMEAELGNLRAVVADQKNKLDKIARAYKDLREEKLSLEAKVKALTEECESLKRSLEAGK